MNVMTHRTKVVTWWWLLLSIAGALVFWWLAFPSRQIPSSIDRWNSIPSYEDAVNRRWWTKGDLQHALQHVGGPNKRTQRLFEKLNSGQPIVAVGFGSSVFHSYAGCYPNPPRPERFQALGIVPSPYSYPQLGQNWSHIHEHLNSLDVNGTWLPYNTCHSSGFMEAVMSQINDAWPHPGHIFLNNAQRASRLDDLVDASCSDVYTPGEVDLVMLDVASTRSSPAAVEKIVRKFALSKSDPVVVLFSQVQNCRGEGRRGGNWSEERYAHCSRNCLQHLDKKACGSLDPEPFSNEENLVLEEERRPYQHVAELYNQPHINFHPLVLKLLNDEEARVRAGAATKWELLSRLFMDHIHFQGCYTPKDKEASSFKCYKNQGPLLLADVLTGWLEGMQKASQSTETHILPHPIHNTSKDHYIIRCYGFSYQQIVASSDSIRDPLRIREATVGTRNFGGFHADTSAAASFNPLPPFNITRSDGWYLVNYYKRKDGSWIFKPGLVSSERGSVLEFKIDSMFFESKLVDAEAILTYTESYDGWGSVNISCSGCGCVGGLVDARGSIRQSVLKSKSFAVTQHKDCIIQVQNLGGKFKINGAVVRIKKEVPMIES